jgi:hypothetical protein
VESVITETRSPDGRDVVLTGTTWAHIVGDKEDMADYEEAVMLTISRPDVREDDPRPGRERFFRRGVGPDRWMRVVVEFRGERDLVVTAFGQSNDPTGV